MKKIYLKMFSILFIGFFGISSYAQGTWKATGTEAAINPSVEITDITTGITGLSCMHSDAATIIGKTDVGATAVTYHNINWDNESYLQGATNGMYFAFRPNEDGILDVPVKMGSGKKTFVLELTDACPYSAVLADVTAAYPTGDLIFGDPTYFTLPSVYDTYNNTTGTWDGSVAIQSSGANAYLVMSFPVLPNKTYVVGCIGSKLMLRGVNYIVTTAVKQFPRDKGVSFNGNQVLNEKGQKIELYNMSGKLIARTSSSISTNNLPNGVYIVRIVGSTGVMKFSK